MTRSEVLVDLALQGGGAHGALPGASSNDCLNSRGSSSTGFPELPQAR